jgi:cellulose synthase (UDP-forming)
MSHSWTCFERFRLHERRRKVTAVAYVAVSIAYLCWRATILNFDALGLSLIYFSAEIAGFLLGLTIVFSSWNYRHRQPLPAPPGLDVDVLVPVYQESIDIIRWTAVAAKEIAYPHRTFILDDGNRPDVKALARDLGIRYLARGRNEHAKAGNLNYGLAHSTADFVVVFDADHIAMPNALDLTLGFFSDERVAMVQTPQEFYNARAFQYYRSRRHRGLWHDQSFFYDIAQACRDSFNGATCIGTGVAYRRSALDAIGGIPVQTVTEDFHTALLMHKKGYEVAYLNEPIAYGVAASDLRDFYRTRHRWAHGNIHVLRHENVLFCGDLTLGQRLSYLSFGLIYLEGVQQALLFLVPILSLLFGWAPFEISVINVLIVLFFPILTLLLLQELGCGLTRPWVNEIFSVARFHIHLISWAALFQNSLAFRTSAKVFGRKIEWRLLLPQLTVVGASLTAFLTGLGYLILDFKSGPLSEAAANIATGSFAEVEWTARLDQGYTLELVVVAGFWAIFNALKSAYLVRKAVVDARDASKEYRFDTNLAIEIETARGTRFARVERISQSWLKAKIFDQTAIRPGEFLNAQLHLPGGTVEVACVVRAVRPAHRFRFGAGALRRPFRRPASVELECDLRWPDPRDQEQLMRSLYSVGWHREFLHRYAYFITPLELLGRLVTLTWSFRDLGLRWHPALYRHPISDEARYGLVTRTEDGAHAVLAFEPLAPGTLMFMTVLGEAAVETMAIRITAERALKSLGAKGLDGAQVRSYCGQVEPERALPDAKLPIAAE